MATVMPCKELLTGETWVWDMTVEGMRQGERLAVTVERGRGLCWAAPPEGVAVDAAGLAPLLLLLLALLSGWTLVTGLTSRLEC